MAATSLAPAEAEKTSVILSGFHAVEERVRAALEDSGAALKMRIYFSKPGPRVKKILELAKSAGIQCEQTDNKVLDQVAPLISKYRDGGVA